MSKVYELTEEVLGYNTAESPTNTDPRHLVGGSRNVLIDQQRKVRTRNGFSIFGANNAAITPIRNAVTWNTSTGTELFLRAYDDEFEVYLATVDGTALDAWYRVKDSLGTTAIPRFTTWFNATEAIDELIFVWGDDNLYKWNGAVAIVSSITGVTVTKTGTTTFAQNRFYTSGTKTFVCVRTGTAYTYTGGETTTTLTGIADTTGLVAGDILVQQVVTTADKPVADRNNNTIYNYENQIAVGSDTDERVYLSKNSDYTNFSYSTPRVPGEGALLTLDGKTNGFATLNDKLIIFSGTESIFQATFVALTVSTTKTETVEVKKYEVGVGQSAQSQEVIVPIGNSILYLSQEPALRELVSLEALSGGKDPVTISNQIKPDFDAATWTGASAIWYKNALYLSAPSDGVLYILEYKEDADNKIRRFWQPPQTLPVRIISIYNSTLYGHSNASPETYNIFDETAYSDTNAAGEKVPINCVAKFAYKSYGKRALLKNFDEYFVEGEISASTTLDLTLYYDYGGYTQTLTKSIDGGDFNISEETLLNSSMAQQPPGSQPLGGNILAPDGTLKFRAILEIAKEDFFEMQAVFSSDDVDKYWAILGHGSNARISSRQPNNKKI